MTVKPHFSRRSALQLMGCAFVGLQAPPLAVAGLVQTRDDLLTVFNEFGVTGTFVLFEPGTNRTIAINAERAATRFITASTFKIPNSLIALETGVIRDENELIPYGGQPQPFKQWEKDMGIREAIAVSNVPIYQELARRIGLERYHHWLKALDYGNQQTGTVVDRFWLDGPIAISAIEQARFVARLGSKILPLSRRTQDIVGDIMKLEAEDGASLYGKTGWLMSASPNLGWWVGWVDRDSKITSFALNIDMPGRQDAAKRIPLAKALLGKLGVY